jgi:hypothetical protein
VTFEEYVATLGPVSRPTPSPEEIAAHVELKKAADALSALKALDRNVLAKQVREHPDWVPVLGLTVGLTRERLRNVLRHEFGTAGWIALARTRPEDLIDALDDNFGLVAELERQRGASYTFGDVLIARAGTREHAGAAIAGGRGVEDAIQAVAEKLGLPCELRTRFVGRDSRTAPCDLAIPGGGGDALIVCAAKGFDSTGSKLSDAVREIEEMAEVRRPTQFVFAVVDGIGWKGRLADLRRIHGLWESNRIDGLYTVASLEAFAIDLDRAATRLGLEGRRGT